MWHCPDGGICTWTQSWLHPTCAACKGKKNWTPNTGSTICLIYGNCHAIWPFWYTDSHSGATGEIENKNCCVTSGARNSLYFRPFFDNLEFRMWNDVGKFMPMSGTCYGWQVHHGRKRIFDFYLWLRITSRTDHVWSMFATSLMPSLCKFVHQNCCFSQIAWLRFTGCRMEMLTSNVL